MEEDVDEEEPAMGSYNDLETNAQDAKKSKQKRMSAMTYHIKAMLKKFPMDAPNDGMKELKDISFYIFDVAQCHFIKKNNTFLGKHSATIKTWNSHKANVSDC